MCLNSYAWRQKPLSDKSVGISVTVCSNLAFGGTAVIKRRHTSRIELTELVDVAMTELRTRLRLAIQVNAGLSRHKRRNISDTK